MSDCVKVHEYLWPLVLADGSRSMCPHCGLWLTKYGLMTDEEVYINRHLWIQVVVEKTP